MVIYQVLKQFNTFTARRGDPSEPRRVEDY